MPRTQGAVPPGYILEARKYVERKYGGRNERIQGVFDRRYQLHEPFVAEAFKKYGIDYRSPLVRDTIRRAQSIISASFPIPHVIPVKTGIRAQDNASKREKWLATAYSKMDRGRNVFSRIIDALVADGEAVWKVYLRTHRWSIDPKHDESDNDFLNRVEETRRAHFPFAWDHVLTTTYYPLSSDNDGVAEVMEITRREAFPVFEQYNLRQRSDGSIYQLENIGDVVSDNDMGTYPDSVQFIEYWNRTHYYYMVDDFVVEEGEHNYGRPPYFHATFNLTSSHDPKYATEGIADVMLRVQDAEDTFVTTLLVWLLLNGQPAARLRPVGDDVDPYETDEEVRMEPGEMFSGPVGTFPEWVPAPSVSGDFHRALDKLNQVSDRVSLAPILYGEQRDISGPTSTNMITVAKSVFGPAVQSIAHQFDEMAAFMQELIETHERLGVPVPVWYEDKTGGVHLELGPNDIDGYYEVEHRVRPSIPMEKAQKAVQLAQAVQMGAVDMDYYREEAMELTDPVEMDRRVTVQDLRKQPEYRNMLMGELARLRLRKLKLRGEAPQEKPMVGPGGPMAPQVQGVQAPTLPGFDMENSGTPQALIRPNEPGGMQIG